MLLAYPAWGVEGTVYFWFLKKMFMDYLEYNIIVVNPLRDRDLCRHEVLWFHAITRGKEKISDMDMVLHSP
jgi:hypothetical protein